MADPNKAELVIAGAFPVSDEAWVMFAGPGTEYYRHLPSGFEGALLSSELSDKVRLHEGIVELFGEGLTAVLIMKMPGFAEIITIQPLDVMTMAPLVKKLLKQFDSDEAHEALVKIEALLTEAAIADGELAKAISLAAQLKVLLVAMDLPSLVGSVDWRSASMELSALTKKHFRGEADDSADDDSNPWRGFVNNLKID